MADANLHTKTLLYFVIRVIFTTFAFLLLSPGVNTASPYKRDMIKLWCRFQID